MARVKIDLPEKFSFQTKIPIRISEINYSGHLGNDAILSIIQEARVRFLKSYGLSEIEKDRTGIIMVDAAIQYKSEGFYGNVLIVEIATADITSTSCDFIYRITNKESKKVVAFAKTGIVFFDHDKKKIIQMPLKFRPVFGGNRLF